MTKRRKRRKHRLSKKILRFFFFAVFVYLVVYGLNYFDVANTEVDESFILGSIVKKENLKKSINDKNNNLNDYYYNLCLSKPYSASDDSADVVSKKDEITKFLGEYRTSVKYEDIKTGYTYSYNSSRVYYAASTIKSLDALYIYSNAAKGEINLDDTIKYTTPYGASKEMSKYKIGSSVTLRNLVKYAITVSDNTAHEMLLKYIGKSKLRQFGLDLGAKYTLSGDDFGNISVDDGIVYMKAINDFINNNGELGEELKGYFVNSEQNDLKLSDKGILAATKYGEYSPNYHNIGIVYDNNPYTIAVLTTELAGNNEDKIRNINSKIYELHRLYNDNRTSLCKDIYKK